MTVRWGGSGTRHGPRRPDPRRGRRVVRIIGLGMLILILAGAAVVRSNIGGHANVAADEVIEIHSAHGTSFVPALQGKRPLFILALGSDARPGEPILHERSDSIHIIGVNLATHRATILGFPRDSWVAIPGHGTAKITTAMNVGGPSLTIATIERLTGIRIDFWVMTSFRGLVGMVDTIGPLTVRVVQGMHDRYSGADFDKGVHKFRGTQALAFARDRHDVPNGDLTRSLNQGKLMQAALAKLRKDFARSPARIFTWLSVGWRNIHTDLGATALLDLILTATQIPSKNVNNLVVPATTGSVGAQSVVFISSGASAIYADMRQDGIAH
jgi:polyisoprenyl-teichoic acid--peptidoglycan teichoic acid transferase